MRTIVNQRRSRAFFAFVIAFTFVCAFTSVYVLHTPLYAQDGSDSEQQVGVYTIAAGDTLFSIADRFGIPVETLVQLNGITDPNLIRIGDVLLIPSTEAVNAISSYSGESTSPPSTDPLINNDANAGESSPQPSSSQPSSLEPITSPSTPLEPVTSPSTGQAIANQLDAIETIAVQALPGESVDMVALRYAQDAELLSLLNGLSRSRRLFPGQMILMPKVTTSSNGILGQKGVEPLRFGAVTQVTLPDTLIQGRTGRLWIQTSRPISLTGTWNGLPIHFSRPEVTPVAEVVANALDAAVPVTTTVEDAFARAPENLWFSLLPVPALIEPRVYPLEISYTASNGVRLSRTWQVEVFAGDYDSQEIVLNNEKGNLLAPSNVQGELELVTKVWSGVETPLLWGGTFTRPIGEEYPTTSPFGIRRSYNGGPYSSYHAGQDFGSPAGVPIIAPAAGVVVLSTGLSVRGNAVIVDHGRGIFSGYWHLSEISVETGQAVEAGDLLGLVGTTGLSTGAHLHWELRVYGIAVDPIQFINERLLELP